MASFSTKSHERIGRLHAGIAIFRQYGFKRLFIRACHQAIRKTGCFPRRFSSYKWDDRPLPFWLSDSAVSVDEIRKAIHSEKSFFFDPDALPESNNIGDGCLHEAGQLLKGRFLYFSSQYGELGFPNPDWKLNPFTGERDTFSGHWTQCPEFDIGRGDIKVIWEPSRFSWVYALCRAYALTGNEDYANAFWLLLESWMEMNPPQMGSNWFCGQELAIRCLALVFGWHVFARSKTSTNERFSRLAVLLAASAERINGNISYARIQMGNHATSEAAALYTIGLLFPCFKQSAHWLAKGRYVLEDEAKCYNWHDGSYTQHSFNYHRLMLHTYLWCLRLADLNNDNFSEDLKKRIQASYLFLYKLQDPDTGRLPNYGPNDGALLLPLNDCDYLDYRPLLNACHFYFEDKHLYPEGSWREDVTWLFNDTTKTASFDVPIRSNTAFKVGGYYTLRGIESWAMIRCHSFRNRPNQADLLHLDLWWKGWNLLRDSGTFSYFTPKSEAANYFVSTRSHNSIMLGGLDQMLKGTRFRWYSLAKSKLIAYRKYPGVDVFCGEHYGYLRLTSRAIHRRTVCHIDDLLWVVFDCVEGEGQETAEIFWNLMQGIDVEDMGEYYRLSKDSRVASLGVYTSNESSCRLVVGSQDPRFMGWESLYYGTREPAPVLICSTPNAPLPLQILTVVSLGSVSSAKVTYGDITTLVVKRNDIRYVMKFDSNGMPGSIKKLGLCGNQTHELISPHHE